MSSSMWDKAAWRADAGASDDQVKWQEPDGPAAAHTPADTVTGFPYFQVELPSRRWYVEAAGEPAVAE